ncbi:MAG: energy-coupling factor transporter transmembrane protein EcfT [Spirochaetaceae bacterium]|nr:energy-coupling factor transporter transmembrane protein EcfT [Spirochaetaceae bacterium]
MNRLEIRHDVLRRFDPRARIAAALLLILAVSRLSNYIVLGCIIAVSMTLLYRDFICILKRLIPIETFCVLFFVQAVCNFITPRTAMIFMLRINCAALLCMGFVVPIGMGTIAAVLERFRVNPKLISIIYLTYRYIYMMHDTVMCSIKAMKLRKCPGRPPAYEWKCYAAVFATALAAALEKSDAVSAALCKRGFDGIIPRTAVWRRRWYDVLLVVCSAVFFTVSVLYIF